MGIANSQHFIRHFSFKTLSLVSGTPFTKYPSD